VATDDFDRTDEDPLGSPWTDLGFAAGDTLRVVSNECGKGSGDGQGETCFYYSGAATTDNQYAQQTVTTLGTLTDQGPAVQVLSSGGENFYWFAGFSAEEQIARFLAGNYSNIATLSISDIAADDVVRIEIDEDGNIEVFINGSSGGTVTDANITGGQPGIFVFEDNCRLDDWSGGDLGVAWPLTHRAVRPNTLLRM